MQTNKNYNRLEVTNFNPQKRYITVYLIRPITISKGNKFNCGNNPVRVKTKRFFFVHVSSNRMVVNSFMTNLTYSR